MSAVVEHKIPGTVLKAWLRSYWALIKSLQTGLLLMTGVAGYLSVLYCHAWAHSQGCSRACSWLSAAPLS